MNIPETPDQEIVPPKFTRPSPQPVKLFSSAIDKQWMKEFFNLTGGSLLYCLSAVFVAYGIVKILGPVLAEGQSWKNAFGCILTLHVYELTLLGAMLLIVFKKVVDDAVSLIILIALYLVGTGIAQGSVYDKDISLALIAGLAGFILAIVKILLMRFGSKIPFRNFAVIGLGILMLANYLGPVLLARAISVQPTQEMLRRDLWWTTTLAMLFGAGLVFYESLRNRSIPFKENPGKNPFLQHPVMAYLFVLIVLFASGIHQYTMAYAFALPREYGDSIPVIALSVLLCVEIFRHWGKSFGFIELILMCVPFGIMMLAIEENAVLSDGRFGPQLIAYPPVFLTLFAVLLIMIALTYHRNSILIVAAIYGLGVVLTVGFSPERPYDLNYHAVVWTLAIGLLIIGFYLRYSYICLAGLFFICFGFAIWEPFRNLVTSHHLSVPGGLAGIFGLGSLLLSLWFGTKIHILIRIISMLSCSVFLYDCLPSALGWSYLVWSIFAGILGWILWLRIKDYSPAIMGSPFLIRLFVLSKQLAFWRFIILGFLLLLFGTVVSLFKRPAQNTDSTTNKNAE